MYNLSTFHQAACTSMAPQPRVPDNQDEIRKRLERVKNEFAEGRQVILAQMTGIQSAELSKILTGSKPISYANLYKIEAGTGIRLEWLEKGIDPIRHPGGKVPARPAPVKEGERLREYVRKTIGTTELAKRLNVNKSTVSGYYTSTNIDALKRRHILSALEATDEAVFGSSTPNPEVVQSYDRQLLRPVVPAESVRMVLKVPVQARAGWEYDAYFKDTENELEFVEIPATWIQKPHLEQAVIVVNGDSMEKTLRAGYEVLAYRVDPADWEYVDNVVAVIYREQFTIKRVSDNQLISAGMLVLTSDNPEGGTRRVSKEDIRDIWRVYRIIKGDL